MDALRLIAGVLLYLFALAGFSLLVVVAGHMLFGLSARLAKFNPWRRG